MNQEEYLIIKYLTKNASKNEVEQLSLWLDQSDENKKTFRSFKHAYDLGKFEEHVKESQADKEWIKLKNRISPDKGKIKRFGLLPRYLKYAAVFIFGILCLQFFYILNRSGEDITQTLVETGVGERSKITLPDGSTIWINTCSSITYNNRYNVEKRDIFLKGEAYFEVASNKEKPFLVHSDLFTCEVTGTTFNICSFDTDEVVSVALLEGGVTVSYKDHSEELHPGEILTYNKKTGNISCEMFNTENITNWRYGILSFDDITFSELTKRLKRSYNVNFIIENDKITDEEFNGSFHNEESLETIMKVIKSSISITYEIKENTIYIR